MRVIWHPDAQNRLRQAVVYVQTEYGRRSSTKFIKEIYRSERLIAKFPHLGSAEPYLADAPVLYRSIVVNRLNKIIYWINDDVIEIVDFWDNRREPKKQAEQVK
ncbi:MAG: type II toxin-antitoxin system RelE/ParE family toxin [Bacteroidales bacterium]|jgi:plasmid stabilization system protein ParE|nr:type II toxin-antitoxin system RelE/ParE family toxin [Bacteroidales bacterium]